MEDYRAAMLPDDQVGLAHQISGHRRSHRCCKVQAIIANLHRTAPLISSTLLPFQNRGIEFGECSIWRAPRFSSDAGVQRHGRCLIGDEMGVGKTLQVQVTPWQPRCGWTVRIDHTGTGYCSVLSERMASASGLSVFAQASHPRWVRAMTTADWTGSLGLKRSSAGCRLLGLPMCLVSATAVHAKSDMFRCVW